MGSVRLVRARVERRGQDGEAWWLEVEKLMESGVLLALCAVMSREGLFERGVAVDRAMLRRASRRWVKFIVMIGEKRA